MNLKLFWCALALVGLLSAVLVWGSYPPPPAPTKPPLTTIEFLSLCEDTDSPAAIANAVNRGSRVTEADDNGFSALFHAAKFNAHPAVISKLIQLGADPNQTNDKDMTPLRAAVGAHQGWNVIHALVAGGASVNFKSSKGESLLMIAVISGSSETTEALIREHADPNVACDDGMTAMHLCILLNPEVSIASALIKAGADVNARDGSGMTVLMTASGKPHAAAIVQLLIAAGADPNIADAKNRFTALHFAAIHGAPESIADLIQAGADTNARDRFGNTPLDMARASNNSQAITLLVKAGAR